MVHWQWLMWSGSRGTMTVIAPQWQLERIGVDSSAMLSCSASLWVLRERELSFGNVESLARWPGELAAVGFI